MKGFYKLDDNGNLIHAPNEVLNKNYSLKIKDKDSYTYPYNGWYYFENEEKALKFFNLKKSSDIKKEYEANLKEAKDRIIKEMTIKHGAEKMKEITEAEE